MSVVGTARARLYEVAREAEETLHLSLPSGAEELSRTCFVEQVRHALVQEKAGARTRGKHHAIDSYLLRLGAPSKKAVFVLPAQIAPPQRMLEPQELHPLVPDTLAVTGSYLQNDEVHHLDELARMFDTDVSFMMRWLTTQGREVDLVEAALQKWLQEGAKAPLKLPILCPDTCTDFSPLADIFSKATGEQLHTIVEQLVVQYPWIKKLSFYACKLKAETVPLLSQLQQVESLNFGYCHTICDENLKCLAKLPALRQLKFYHCELITDAGLQHLSTCKTLTSLKVSNSKISDAGVAYLRELPLLQYLHLTSEAITDRGLEHLSQFPTLQVLWLPCCPNITDEGFRHLIALQELEDLYLFGCHQLTNNALLHIGKIRTLKKLSVGNCEQITERGLQYLRECKQLERLDVRHCNDILDTVAGFKSLREIDLDGCFGMSEVALCNLAEEMQGLQELHLPSRTNTTDAVLEEIAKKGTIERLYLGGDDPHPDSQTTISDAGLKSLLQLPRLKVLDIQRCRGLTEAGLCHFLENAKELQKLSLPVGPQLTDAVLEKVAKLASIEELELGDNHHQASPYSDAGLKALSALPHLKSLRLHKRRGVTPAAVAYLRERHPRLDVIVYG